MKVSRARLHLDGVLAVSDDYGVLSSGLSLGQMSFNSIFIEYRPTTLLEILLPGGSLSVDLRSQ